MTKKRKMTITIVAVITLFVMIAGATYAYFTANGTFNFSTRHVSITASDKGSVHLTKNNSNLALNLTLRDLMISDDNITYYATEDGTPSLEYTYVTLGTATTTGAAYYTCDYTLTASVTPNDNIYTAFQSMADKSTNQIVLKVGKNTYDFNTANLFPITITGKIYNVTSSNPGYINASLAFTNYNDKDQSDLLGKELNINLNVTSFTCESAVEAFDTPTLANAVKSKPLMIEYRGEGYYHDNNDKDTEHPFFTRPIYYWYAENSTDANTIRNSWNVVYAGSCWQMIRTTEQGGVKLLYNGEPSTTITNGVTSYDCGDYRYSYHMGGIESEYDISGTKVYGTGYTSLETVAGVETTFTLTSTSSKTITSSNASEVVGMYTCGNTNTSCTNDNLKKIVSIKNGTTAIVYTSTERDNIGHSAFSQDYSPAYAGYMYNEAIDEKTVFFNSISSNIYNFSNTITYNNVTNKYTIDMTDSNAISIWNFDSSTEHNKIGKAHYVCLDDTTNHNLVINQTECTWIGYVYIVNMYDYTYIRYMPLSGGKYISTDTNSTTGMTKWADEKNSLYKMLYIDNVNTIDSTIKSNIDKWYVENIYNSLGEFLIDNEEIFCNDRSISDFGSWNLNANNMSTAISFYGLGYKSMLINNSNAEVYNLSCPNKLDAFSKVETSKGNGALDYSIGLIGYPEMMNLAYDIPRSTSYLFFLMSPYSFITGPFELGVNIDGWISGYNSHIAYGVRPSIALTAAAEFTSGTGAMNNPYIVE